ncbi:cilia- and flagella-associated protein 99-like [Vespula squamosa]|uniref:Cilia- and flagella-associated protein 99-like n=1 Tax=Vespula squamosa TaxID=30214 RepID=A0ABD2B9M4_VESSQ
MDALARLTDHDIHAGHDYSSNYFTLEGWPMTIAQNFYFDKTKEFSFINKRNVYQLSLVLPVIEMLDVFMSRKHNLSPDEFCLVLFMRETIDEKNCKSYSNSLKYLVENVKDIQVSSESLHYEIAELFMTIIRFEFPLKIACEDFVKQRLYYKRNHDLCEIMDTQMLHCNAMVT